MFNICVFGTTRIHTRNRIIETYDLPATKPRQLLEIIVLGRGALLRKPAIAEALWAGSPPAHWQATLESYVSQLRRALEPGVPARDAVIRTGAGGYRLDTARVHLDLDDFDTVVAGAAAGTPPVGLKLWEQAVGLAEHDVLEHEPYAEWTQRTREEYRHRAVRAAVAGAHLALDLARWDRAEALATAAVRRDTLAEDGWQALIATYGRSGRPAEALRAFRTCRQALHDELGVDVSATTRRLLTVAVEHGAPAPASRTPEVV